MEKVAEFYARWFAKKAAQEYWAAEAASEELANELIGVHESNKRDFWQTCAVRFLHGTILHLSSKAALEILRRRRVPFVVDRCRFAKDADYVRTFPTDACRPSPSAGWLESAPNINPEPARSGT